MPYDTVITGGRWFDGMGTQSAIRDIGLRDGRVATISAAPLDRTNAELIDATGQWVIPGMIDIHTHYDVESLCAPELAESLRHGVTTVFVGSCSLSTVYIDNVDAGDIFGRVEAIPRRHVIETLDRARCWSNPSEYVAALHTHNLGPNIAAFIGHSDMRAATMGLDRATRRDVHPRAGELARMKSMLHEALDEGFVGMSSQQLLFDKLDGEVCRSRTLPSTYATAKELRCLNAILRNRGRVLQSGPNINNPLSVASQLAASLGVGRPRLKTSLLAAADTKANPGMVQVMDHLARIVNALGGDFRWQHLPVPFEVYADGISLVVFEEFGSGAAALHLQSEIERNRLMGEENYRRQFRKEYDKKFGPRVWHRDFFDAEIVGCPDRSVIGKSFGQVGIDRGGLHPVDAFLDLVVEHGEQLRWRTTISNHRPALLKKLARSTQVQIGFSDAGAHLRNMAFYNCGLRLLRHVQEANRQGIGFMSAERAVHRLTGELAAWYDIDAGTLCQGDRADLAIINPDRLDDSLERYAEHPIEAFGGLSRMVNRNDRTVTTVMVNGETVFTNGRPAAALGHRRFGQFLRAGRATTKLTTAA
ncbi:N-acyl-D-amino-acid deacylase family protein [Mycobacterium spongiae]|uniref:Amidohydrolase family protein n=1 Tax=Mycobacterium spongiae TaxID=886343 RepID=A0A975JYU7_9MYCO|nr:amidohydrolase family protein [Mycobacterium spongiae]QUR67820.1 amidohydrolase family protein [Mycobacterium spongiae]